MYKKNQLVDCYSYDEHGHYTGIVSAQVLNDGEEPNYPPYTVSFAPDDDPDYFYEISDDLSKWNAIKKPTTASECVGIYIKHEDQCDYAHEMRKLFEKLTENNPDYEQYRDPDNLTLTVREKQKETENEIMLQSSNQEIQDFENQVKDLREQMVTAMLLNDQDMIDSIRAEFKQLTEGE